MTVLGKSAHRSRKRFGGILQRYVLLDIAWTETAGRIPVLEDAAIAESFWNILGDWESVRHADYLLELASVLFPQPGPKPKAFSLLLSGMRALSGGRLPRALARTAEAAFLSIAGFGPDLSSCKGCGRTDNAPFRFLFSEGRLYCKNCPSTGGVPLSLGAVKTWRILQSPSAPAKERIRISENILDELQIVIPVIPKYLEWCIGKQMRSLAGEVSAGKP